MRRADEQIVIVVGVDGSATSLRAGAYAAGMARRLEARLVALFVHTVSGLAVTAPSLAPAVMAAQRDIAAQLRQALAAAELSDLELTFVERTGNPYHQLRDLATEVRADAVVVGASMQAGHRLVGSLAGHLVRDAAWPVTVVP